MNRKLESKAAGVTAGGTGIGFGTAKHFAGAGAASVHNWRPPNRSSIVKLT